MTQHFLIRFLLPRSESGVCLKWSRKKNPDNDFKRAVQTIITREALFTWEEKVLPAAGEFLKKMPEGQNSLVNYINKKSRADKTRTCDP